MGFWRLRNRDFVEFGKLCFWYGSPLQRSPPPNYEQSPGAYCGSSFLFFRRRPCGNKGFWEHGFWEQGFWEQGFFGARVLGTTISGAGFFLGTKGLGTTVFGTRRTQHPNIQKPKSQYSKPLNLNPKPERPKSENPILENPKPQNPKPECPKPKKSVKGPGPAWRGLARPGGAWPGLAGPGGAWPGVFFGRGAPSLASLERKGLSAHAEPKVGGFRGRVLENMLILRSKHLVLLWAEGTMPFSSEHLACYGLVPGRYICILIS